METILGFSAQVYEVRQLSWRPAQVNSCAFFKALLYSAIRNQAGPVQPGHIHVGLEWAEVYKKGTVVSLHHSATTLGGDHTSRHIEKKHHPRDQRKNRLL